MPELTLFVDAYWVSPFDFSCYVALREKGLPFNTSRVTMHTGFGLPAAYRQRVPMARVPALAHDDFWLSESMAVVEYLEDAFPPPEWPRLLPADPRARARTRQIMSFVRSELGVLRRERSSWRIVYPQKEPPPPFDRIGRLEADELVQVTERLLASGDLAEWSVASADLAFALLRLVRTGEHVPDDVARFVDAVCERPSVREFLEHPRPPNPPPER
jgi:glutathione S-transferase